MGRGVTCSSSSSLESSNCQGFSTNISFSHLKRDLSTDLRLGLSVSASQQNDPSIQSGKQLDWPPINSFMRQALAAEESECNSATFFVKVYMEGIPIGRKLNLLAHDSYYDLIRTLDHMFNTTILWAEMEGEQTDGCHVLTYEDKEGDWLMVGDVPWEMFLSSVKRLKITRAEMLERLLQKLKALEVNETCKTEPVDFVRSRKQTLKKKLDMLNNVG